ncbi:MAG: hypothetical protein V1726_08670 [Methanobacteriota archaeon]
MGLFGPDKITLSLEKFDYKPGDNIKGTVTLNLKKPTKARNLTVSLIGRVTEKTQGTSVRVSGGSPRVHSSSQTRTFDIYNFAMPLEGEKEYSEGTYPFDMKIPENIFQTEQKPVGPQYEGALGTLAKIAAGASPYHTYSRIDWFVESRLDIPMGLDVRKSQKIVLSP